MAARTAPFGMCAIIQAVNELEEKEEEKEKQLPSWNSVWTRDMVNTHSETW